MSKKSERIKVSIRCRPMSQKEKNEGYQNCVDVDSDRGDVCVNLINMLEELFGTIKPMEWIQPKNKSFKKQQCQ